MKQEDPGRPPKDLLWKKGNRPKPPGWGFSQIRIHTHVLNVEAGTIWHHLSNDQWFNLQPHGTMHGAIHHQPNIIHIVPRLRQKHTVLLDTLATHVWGPDHLGALMVEETQVVCSISQMHCPITSTSSSGPCVEMVERVRTVSSRLRPADFMSMGCHVAGPPWHGGL